MSRDDGKLFIYSAIGFGAGVYFFFKGFKVYRELRVLEDTPCLPIRSIPMGLVQVHGKATGENVVTSPVSNTPCHFYKVDIEKWVTDKNGGRWSHYATDADGPLFYLDDGTGKVLVDAHNAEYDLMQNARRETSGALGSLLSGISGSPATGTAGNLPAYIGSVHTKHAGLGLSMGLGGISLGGGSSSGRFRLTEYLILPGHWYDVVGSCTENPAPKDAHDRNLIKKGQNEPTYLITWKTEKQEASTLKWRALGYIFGGAALSLVCAAIILAKLGWL
ncbi:MAG: hypothetical protein DMG21_16605 [Acidobacteria bacterium]|nr:MAG: hypothetical protein DMG21_16605 [Acidobacteriota bacterium]